jgi:hypothetical protein
MINETNYFDLNNKGLSQSKIKDYLICPNYFYRKNISGSLKRAFKKEFIIGDAVDGILTRATEKDNYAVCEAKRTTKEGKAEALDLQFKGKTVISRADYDQIIEIADAVMNTDAYKEIAATFTFQEIVEVPMELGKHFDCLYGKIDAYRINEDGICDLLDIKTAVSIEDRQYFYKFFNLRYDVQLWFYSYLLKSKYPQIKGFRFWHLAAGKSEPYAVKLYPIPVGLIMACANEVMETIDKIIGDTEFKKHNPSFATPDKFFNPDGGWEDDKGNE